MKCRECGRDFDSDAGAGCIDDAMKQLREAWADIKRRLIWLRESDDGKAFDRMDSLLEGEGASK